MKYPPIVKVNLQGKPLGPITYRQGHPLKTETKGPRHTTTNILLFKDNSRKEVLISLRSNIFMGGRWDSSAGGHIHWDVLGKCQENDKDTACREVNEELFSGKKLPSSLKLEKVGSFWKWTRPNDHEWVHLFAGVYKGPFFPNKKEVAKVRFIPVDLLLKNTQTYTGEFTRSVGVCIRKYLELTKNGKR